MQDREKVVRPPGPVLGPRKARQYRRDGVIRAFPLLSKAQAEGYRKEFEKIEQAMGAPLLRFDWSHLFFAWAYDLATHPDLLDAMEALLGPDILIWGSLISQKPARTHFHFSWHQDCVFNPFLTSRAAATAWIALTESTTENGCLRVLPASHTCVFAHTPVETAGNLLRPQRQVTVAVDESQSEDLVLRAGEVSVQDIALLHSSGANRSDSPRIGFIVRFSIPEIKATAYPMIRARGCRAYGHLTFWDPPADNDLDRGLRGREALLTALGRDR